MMNFLKQERKQAERLVLRRENIGNRDGDGRSREEVLGAAVGAEDIVQNSNTNGKRCLIHPKN